MLYKLQNNKRKTINTLLIHQHFCDNVNQQGLSHFIIQTTTQIISTAIQTTVSISYSGKIRGDKEMDPQSLYNVYVTGNVVLPD